MDKELDKGKQKEAMDPIMMDENKKNKIMEKSRMTLGWTLVVGTVALGSTSMICFLIPRFDL
jgi:hypothetical protein